MAKVYNYTGVTTMGSILTTLKECIISNFDSGEVNNWKIVFDDSEKIVAEMTSEQDANGVSQKAYIRFERYDKVGSKGRSNHLKVTYSGECDSATGDLINPSPESFFTVWVNAGENGVFVRTDEMRFQYSVTIDNNSLLVVMEGDPTLDYKTNFNSFLYFGTIETFSDEDNVGSIAFTCGCSPLKFDTVGGLKEAEFTFTDDRQKKYGTYTSKGMEDISMLKSWAMIPYQQHFPAFLSESSVVNKTSQVTGQNNQYFFNSSKWTDDYHASPLYAVHPVDGYRGYLRNVVAVNRLNLLKTDILREEVGQDSNGDPIYHEYKAIDIHKNSGTNFLTKSSNPEYIIAVRIK